MSIVFIFTSLKLFYIEQNIIINCIPNNKAIVLIGKNNLKKI